MRAVIAALLAIVLAPAAVPACSIAVFPHEIDPAACAVDTNRPEPPALEVETITRGRGPKRDGEAISVTSCDDIGFIHLAFRTPPRDDRTPREQLGFLVVHTEGELPAGMTLPDEALRAPGETYTLHWIDGATDDQEPIAFAVSLIALDVAGNRSEPSAPVWIRHPGTESR
ncbi:MAG: hypothetical protein ACRD2J_05855 [Thermoanaerobaculia bacterium]